MKKILALALFAVALVSCRQTMQTDGFKLSGHLEGLQVGDTLFLKTFLLPDWKEDGTDTILVEKEGIFSAFIPMEHTTFYLLTHQPKVGEPLRSCIRGAEIIARVGDDIKLEGSLDYLGAVRHSGGFYDNSLVARYDSLTASSNTEMIDIFSQILKYQDTKQNDSVAKYGQMYNEYHRPLILKTVRDSLALKVNDMESVSYTHLGIGLCLLSACTEVDNKLEVDRALEYCDRQVHRTLEVMHGKGREVDYTMMPRNIMDGQSDWNYRKVSKEEWCGGFWPGILWYDYEYTQDPKIKEEAEKFTASLKFLSEIPAYDHDLGFLVFCSYGNGYRLTGNPEYKQVIINTADSLSALFNPRVGTMLSWPRNVKMFGGHNTIMDNMINLEMLFWAAKNGGNPYLFDIAVAHADKTMKYHFRPDYTSYHVAVYDTLTGEFIKGVTHQGYSDDSMWARGQAWAIYGYTVVYRETKDVRYLDFVQKVTDVYLKNLPEDYVPYWDFNDPSIPDAPRDASAACVVASALLELSGYLPAEKALEYKQAAVKMLTSLSSDKYQCGESKPAFLLHSTGHLPAESEIDASIIYADYYYMEALLRLKRLTENKPVIDE